MNTSVDLKQVISKLDSLPPMPLELNTDEGEAMLLTLIGLDPLISAKIIGLANTSLFGSSVKVSSISDAALRLGLRLR